MDFDEPNKLLHADLNDHNMLSSPTLPSNVDADVVLPGYKQELTTKKALELLLEGTLKSKVCRYCLNISTSLSELDQVLQVAGTGSLYKVTIREMVASFHPFKAVMDPNLPNKICNKCLNGTISSYLFAQQCERSERALQNCFSDIYDQLEKLDPLERTSKRGRQKRNPNYNILYTDHRRVIDYAQPVINIVNIKSTSLSNEPAISELECPKCWQLFTNIENLIVHEKTHPSSMWFNCRLCGKSFVKRLQWKRHLKQAHKGPKMDEVETFKNETFQCKTCDFTSEDYSSHVQHMEKHKFQTVLKHLIEKDMDKLCAVCFDKQPDLVDLDEMVRLHGGYPGVTGDKTLYSILGSTLPDRDSYKYQELHVPYHAKILKFAKLPNGTEHQIDTNKNDDKKSNANRIVISNPVVITSDEIDCDERHCFLFSDPIYFNDGQIDFEKNNPFVVPLEYKEVEVKDSKIDTKIDINEVTPETPLDILRNFNSSINNYPPLANKDNEKVAFAENINYQGKRFVFSKPDYKVVDLIDIETGDAKKEMPDVKLCKNCWIFNKATCATCVSKLSYKKKLIEGDIANIAIVTNNGIQKDCQYCWIFKCCEECDFCKKINKIDTAAIITEKESPDESIGLKAERKKILPHKDTKTQKKKWDCHVCLISNVKERETCICCESNRNGQNVVQVDFSRSNPFKIHTDDEITSQDIKDAEMHLVTKTMTSSHDLKETMQKFESVFDKESLQNVTQVKMDFTLPEASHNNNLTNNNDDAVKMDIEEETSGNILPSRSNSFSFNIPVQSYAGMQNSGLQFNIGAGFSREKGNRRTIKAVRRMAYRE